LSVDAEPSVVVQAATAAHVLLALIQVELAAHEAVPHLHAKVFFAEPSVETQAATHELSDDLQNPLTAQFSFVPHLHADPDVAAEKSVAEQADKLAHVLDDEVHFCPIAQTADPHLHTAAVDAEPSVVVQATIHELSALLQKPLFAHASFVPHLHTAPDEFAVD